MWHQNNLKSVTIFLVSILMLANMACSKGSDTAAVTPTPPAEEKLTFTVNPDPGTTVYPVLGATLDITISVTSKMGAAGVTATISVTKDLDGSSVFSQTLSSTTASFVATIQNLKNGELCTTSISLVSKTTATNIASKSFKVARK